MTDKVQALLDYAKTLDLACVLVPSPVVLVFGSYSSATSHQIDVEVPHD